MSAAENEPGEALVEDQSDRDKTRMAYAADGRMPWLMTVIWIVSVLALVAYWAVYAVPDVARWGAP